MTDNDRSPRSVQIERTGFGTYRATTASGATLDFGQGDGLLTPVELLLTAIAGCSAIDVDYITSRRAEPTSFTVESSGDKVSADGDNYLENLKLTFDVRFPDGPDGDAARERLPQAVKRSQEALCTVSRTVGRGEKVATEIVVS